MGPVVLDAGVVIGFLDENDAHHERADSALAQRVRAPKLMSTVNYAEVLVRSIAKGRDEVLERFLVAADVELVPVGRSLARRAAALRSELAGVSLADCFALATAIDREAELLTFDAQLNLAWDCSR